MILWTSNQKPSFFKKLGFFAPRPWRLPYIRLDSGFREFQFTARFRSPSQFQ